MIETRDLLLHPIRLRVVQALAGRRLTPSQIKERLGDVPQASLYRHIKQLADHGLIEVVDERQVRGSVERTYALARDGVGYRQVPLWLTDDEFDAMIETMRSAVEEHVDNEPTPGRRRRLLTTIVMPDDRH